MNERIVVLNIVLTTVAGVVQRSTWLQMGQTSKPLWSELELA